MHLFRRTCTGQDVDDGLFIGGLSQLSGSLLVTQHMGELAQDAQMLVGLGGDADGHIGRLPLIPLDALGELGHHDTCALDQMAGVRGAVGNGDAAAKVGGVLGFPRQHAVHITGLHQTRFGQFACQQGDGVRLGRHRLSQQDLLSRQLQHRDSPSGPASPRGTPAQLNLDFG
ncbi:hypothetical protein D3C85_1061520 [compost metagenome]